VLQAARAGKPVIGEKPWVLGADEARLLAEELEGCPPVPVASCASRFRFTPATAAAVACLREGALDRVRLVRVSAVTPPPAPLAELPPWKRSAAAAGGGLAADWCVYEIDWLAAVFGAAFDPVEVTATLDDWRREGTGLDSGYTAHLRCASGLDVRLDRRAEIAPRQHRVEIRCEHGGIDLPFAPDTSDRIARLHRPAEDGKGIVSKEIAPALDDWSDILCGPLVNLADAVRGTAPVAATPASQILVHTLLDAIYRSGREGKSVLLEKP
jgi:predicted dehydrogenase